ncbi:MAG TPA: hypothetical protein GXZ60_04800 [Intrasporangiaceae bacterium]|nr:hypothetical protein [Intrasporangiaceae bacterium]
MPFPSAVGSLVGALDAPLSCVGAGSVAGVSVVVGDNGADGAAESPPPDPQAVSASSAAAITVNLAWA